MKLYYGKFRVVENESKNILSVCVFLLKKRWIGIIFRSLDAFLQDLSIPHLDCNSRHDTSEKTPKTCPKWWKSRKGRISAVYRVHQCLSYYFINYFHFDSEFYCAIGLTQTIAIRCVFGVKQPTFYSDFGPHRLLLGDSCRWCWC